MFQAELAARELGEPADRIAFDPLEEALEADEDALRLSRAAKLDERLPATSWMKDMQSLRDDEVEEQLRLLGRSLDACGSFTFNSSTFIRSQLPLIAFVRLTTRNARLGARSCLMRSRHSTRSF